MTIKIKYNNNDAKYIFDSFDKIKNYDNVVFIDCAHNKLSVLPELPNSLQILWC